MTLFDVEGVETSKPAAPRGPLVRVRMVVAYDGTDFRGFATQGPSSTVRTVAGVLTAAIERVVRERVTLTCAGRTDAGVHAWGQVVSFDAPEGVDVDVVLRSCNRQLAPEVVVRSAEVAGEGFDARRSARARRYRYTIVNRAVPDPFLARFAWHVTSPLDVPAMRLACDPVIGEHDFSSFCRRPRHEASLTRRVLDARWLELGEGILRFDVDASSFCQQMVRSLVGTMVDMGMGRKRAGEMSGILRAADRHFAGEPAPPNGLTLWEVVY